MKLKVFFKKYYIYMLAFFIPIVCFIIGLTVAKFMPFGKDLLEIYDGYHQYPGLASYYSNVLKGTSSLLYSFKGALGYNFYAIAVYYLFNPTSLLLIFFNNTNLYIYYTLVIILKVGLCGLSCSILLKYLKRKNITTLLCSTAYALCAYNLMYFSNYMWIDSLYLLPLVLVGLNRLIYKGKNLMYLITLSITIISNFYIGYMVCIFSLLYFIINFFYMKKDERRKGLIKDFVIVSLCAGLISAFVIVPVTLELFMGKSELYKEGVGITKYFKFDFDAISAFYKFSVGSSSYRDISYGTPNLYCSLLVFIYFISSFFNKAFSKREKICNSILFVYFIFGLSFNLIDYSWQLFQQPIWYPVRYAFLINIFMIIVASKSFDNREKININLIFKILIFLALIGLMFIGAKLSKIEFTKITDLSVICFILSTILTAEYLFSSTDKSTLIKFFIVALFFLEITFNSIFTLKILGRSKLIDVEKNIIKEHISMYDKVLDNDKSFYRLESNSKHNYNNGALYDYNGINFFSSIRNNNVINFLDYYTDVKVVDYCSVTYNFLNPILNNILGIKYITSNNQMFYYSGYYENNSGIYLNKDAFSLGYLVNKNIYDIDLEKNEFNQNYNNIVNGMLGYNINLIEKIEGKITNAVINDKDSYELIDNNSGTSSTIKYNIKNKNGFIILDREGQSQNLFRILLNGKDIESATTIASFLYIDKTDELELIFTISNNTPTRRTDVTFIPYNSYVEFITNVKAGEMKITNYESDSHFEATINSTVDKNVLFTTIPYDKGWNIYVDGEEYEYKSALNNAFITLELNPGEHTIIFNYVPRGLILGVVLSFAGIITFLFHLLKRKTNKKLKNI